MSPEKPSAPAPEVIDALLTRVRPEAEVLFRRHDLSSEQASESLEAALRILLYRWMRIADPERWLLQALADEAARRAKPIP